MTTHKPGMVLTVRYTSTELPYIGDNELNSEIKKHCTNPDEIWIAFHKILYGSTRIRLGFYPWDIKCAFDKLNITAVFYDETKNKEIDVNSELSGAHNIPFTFEA